ncbi:MAG: hypothetical protein HY319_04860 [Armatimonadetes bacterium]|nr:hypothetical protein [Armatimonadota bacterium]
MRPDRAVPIVRAYDVQLDSRERSRAKRLARRLTRAHPELQAPRFHSRARTGLDPRLPGLVLADCSGVTLSPPGTAIEHRMMFLADEGDIVVLAAPRAPAFEAYCRRLLGLESVEVVSLRTERGTSLGRRCLYDEELMDRLCERAREAGGLNLKPYMGTPSVWELASALGARARVPIYVAAPPASLALRVNDKTWFSRCSQELLGPHSIPPSRPACGLAELARHVRTLSRAGSHLVVKLPSSAASAGNLVLDCRALHDLSPGDLFHFLEATLSEGPLAGRFPVLVSIWESPVLASPSVQLWIPLEGEPVVEGVFSQDLSPRLARFLGARPAVLPGNTAFRLAAEASLLATCFQELGYFGRCSFDAILVGRDPSRCDLHWVECNGRWGGTSLPMTLANRLLGDWRKRAMLVVHSMRPGPSSPWSVQSFLYPQRNRSGIVWLVPHRMSFMALAPDIRQAEREAQAVMAGLGAQSAAL